MKESTLAKHKLVIDEWFINGFNGNSDSNFGNDYYVYALIDPLSGCPFYIGKGKGDRSLQHERDFLSGRVYNPFKDKVISNIIANGLNLITKVIVKDLQEDESYKIERFLIKQFKQRLTNIKYGLKTKNEVSLEMAKIVKSRIINLDSFLMKNPTQSDLEIYHSSIELLNKLIKRLAA